MSTVHSLQSTDLDSKSPSFSGSFCVCTEICRLSTLRMATSDVPAIGRLRLQGCAGTRHGLRLVCTESSDSRAPIRLERVEIGEESARLVVARRKAGFGFLPSPALPTSCGSELVGHQRLRRTSQPRGCELTSRLGCSRPTAATRAPRPRGRGPVSPQGYGSITGEIGAIQAVRCSSRAPRKELLFITPPSFTNVRHGAPVPSRPSVRRKHSQFSCGRASNGRRRTCEEGAHSVIFKM